VSRRIRLRIPIAVRAKVERQLYECELMDAATAGSLELVEVRPYMPGRYMLVVLEPPVPPVGRIA
jgi:hypothetical protein